MFHILYMNLMNWVSLHGCLYQSRQFNIHVWWPERSEKIVLVKIKMLDLFISPLFCLESGRGGSWKELDADLLIINANSKRELPVLDTVKIQLLKCHIMGSGSPDKFFSKPVKWNQYFLYMRVLFYIFSLPHPEKNKINVSARVLEYIYRTNSKTSSESRIKILFRYSCILTWVYLMVDLRWSR